MTNQDLSIRNDARVFLFCNKCLTYDSNGSIVNKLHLNAFYDVLNRIYTDVLVQTAADYNESRACATMIDRSKLEHVILVADRGYENYNIFAHAIEKGWKFQLYKQSLH